MSYNHYHDTYHASDEDRSRRGTTPSGASFIVPTIIGGLGIILTGGIGRASTAVALASPRLATATFYIGATGGAALGTGYVVVKGGKLIVQKARPGTIVAANRAVRDARAAAQVAGRSVTTTTGAAQANIAEGSYAVAEAGIATGALMVNSAASIGNRLVKLLPKYRILLDPKVAGQGQSHISLAEEGSQNTQTEADTERSRHVFIAQERDDGIIELRRIGNVADLGENFQEAEPTVAGPSTFSVREETVHLTSATALEEWEKLSFEDEEDFVEITALSEESELGSAIEQSDPRSSSDGQSFTTANSGTSV